MATTYVDVKLGIRRIDIVDHPVAAPSIGEAGKVDREPIENSELCEYEARGLSDK